MDTKASPDNIAHWAYLHTSLYDVSEIKNLLLDPSLPPHDPQALDKATTWFRSLDLNHIHALFVYGLGDTGEAYIVAKEWLQKNKDHYLIVVEDDLMRIRRFLETDLATEFLNNAQAVLFYWDRTKAFFDIARFISIPLSLKSFVVSALPDYAEIRSEQCMQFNSDITFWMNLSRIMEGEATSFGQSFFVNFYPNLLKLPAAYQAKEMFGKFVGVPAIICGAGPSLEKNFHVLETLKDHALIFAGATAMNALNAHGFMPHLGVGIDPNTAQLTRLIANQAYEVPYLYRNRLNHEALKIIHGPRIYAPGTSGYDISKWVENELDIHGPHIREGYNVVNFSLALAHAFGCNPIILVGVDLAYSEGKSYYPGVKNHPIHSYKEDFLTKTPQETLYTKNDIYGKPVQTLWKWIAEAAWYGHYVKENPNVLIINSTEGGIGMPGIPNRPLKESGDIFLQRQIALSVKLHGEMQNASMPEKVTDEEMQKTLRTLLESCHTAEALAKTLYDNVSKYLEELESGKQEFQLEIPAEDAEIWKKLKEETAYKYILKDYETTFQQRHALETARLNYALSHKENQPKRIRIIKDLYLYLGHVIHTNEYLIQFSLDKDKLIRSKTLSVKNPLRLETKPLHPQERYEYDAQTFTIVDPELNLSIHEKYFSHPYKDTNGKTEERYPNDQVKFEQFYLNNQLHGPSSFYKDDGTLLAREWYVNGKKTGKALFYYKSGALYCVQSFSEKGPEGLHEYYYPDGIVKSQINYSKGKLDGEVVLYHPTGHKFRELHYINGLKHGFERMWSLSGMRLLEVEYNQDRAVGSAKAWYEDGQPAKEIVYDAQGKQIESKRWNQQGVLVPEKGSPDDLFDSAARKANILTDTMENIYGRLQKMMPSLHSEYPTVEVSSENQLKQLKSSFSDLHKLGEELLKSAGMHSDDMSEQIWKTPETERNLKSHIENMSSQLNNHLKQLTDAIQHMRQADNKHTDDKKHDRQ